MVTSNSKTFVQLTCLLTVVLPLENSPQPHVSVITPPSSPDTQLTVVSSQLFQTVV